MPGRSAHPWPVAVWSAMLEPPPSPFLAPKLYFRAEIQGAGCGRWLASVGAATRNAALSGPAGPGFAVEPIAAAHGPTPL